MNQDVRQRAILLVSSLGHLDILELLLRLGPISAEARDSAITQAGGERGAAIRDMLRMTPVIATATRSSFGEGEMEVSLGEIQEDPLQALGVFVALPSLPVRFHLQETPQVIDLGGVSKQVYATLMESLVEKSCLRLTSQDLPKLAEEKDLSTFEQLGKFYSLLQARNVGRSDPFLTGEVFSPFFFALAKLILTNKSEEALQREAAALLKDLEKDFSPCFNFILKPSSKDDKAAVKEMQEVCDDDREEMVFAQEILESFLALPRAFALACSDSLQTTIKNSDPEALCQKIQGEAITTEGILRSLVMENPTPLLERQVGWLREKISSSSLEWQKAFVKSITGRSCLEGNVNIIMRPSWRGVFEFHTCFNSLDLPQLDLNDPEMTEEEFKKFKEDFLQALDVAIEGEGYNIA